EIPQGCGEGKPLARGSRLENEGGNSFLQLGFPNLFFYLFFCQDYKSENSTLLPGAKNSLQDSVSRSILLNRLDFETTFASFSASLVSVINHREWFLPETDLAGEVTGFEGNKFSRSRAQFLLGNTWPVFPASGTCCESCILSSNKDQVHLVDRCGHSGW
uniref:Uncharacterized protein n=1 Tax=Rhinopithecus bieti TaxID=61621 RepID=A0A2K6LFB0_RHIBE